MKPLENLIIAAIKLVIDSEEPPPPASRVKEILVVEDTSQDFELAKSAFKGHKVHLAKDFQGAMVMLDEIKHLDAAFIDLNIPGGHGMDLVNKVMMEFPTAAVAAVPGDASVMRPGDEAWVIMKHPRMAKSFADFLKRTPNGNGSGRKETVNYTRVAILITLVAFFFWVSGELKWFEIGSNLLKQLFP